MDRAIAFYFTIKMPEILWSQKLFMMAWNSRDIHGFLLQYISICILERLILNINEPERMLYLCQGPDSYQYCCEINTLS